ncbi:MAG: hypothetical protein ACSLEL_04540 [Candidatus Malihini olakiniferum]
MLNIIRTNVRESEQVEGNVLALSPVATSASTFSIALWMDSPLIRLLPAGEHTLQHSEQAILRYAKS